jgi:hypothetical protein
MAYEDFPANPLAFAECDQIWDIEENVLLSQSRGGPCPVRNPKPPSSTSATS